MGVPNQGIEDWEFEMKMHKLGNKGWELAFACIAISSEGYSTRGVYECIFNKVTSSNAVYAVKLNLWHNFAYVDTIR